MPRGCSVGRIAALRSALLAGLVCGGQGLVAFSTWAACLECKALPHGHRHECDHVVRDQAELSRIIAYVLENPMKAGLVGPHDQWKWSYSRVQV